MGSQAKFKRKKFLIDKGFQLAYVGKILLLEFIAVGATALMVSYMFLFVFNDDALVNAGPWGSGILWGTIILAAMLIAILAFLGIRISHRIAGPIYRFHQTFEEVKSGNVNARIYLRENDEMKPLALAFNGMLDVISEQIHQQKTGEYRIETLEEKMKEVMSAIGHSDMPAADKDKYRKILSGLMQKL
jgi:methyl-accepting chemotaxis protein